MLAPPNGTQGMAQPVAPEPVTSGTCALIRPILLGSAMSVTLPRYLPRNCREPLMVAPSCRHHHRRDGAGPFAAELKALRVAPAGELVGHALHEPVAVVGVAGAAHADDAPGAKHVAVADGVERAAAVQRVRAAEGRRPGDPRRV